MTLEVRSTFSKQWATHSDKHKKHKHIGLQDPDNFSPLSWTTVYNLFKVSLVGMVYKIYAIPRTDVPMNMPT